MPKMRVKAKHGRAGWWSRGLLGEADHFPVGKAGGPKARGISCVRGQTKRPAPEGAGLSKGKGNVISHYRACGKHTLSSAQSSV